MPRPALRTAVTAPLLTLLTLLSLVAPALVAAPADAANRATPGNFTGYGFDQCLAPTQRAMNAWLKSSPFLAVGIYISGESRGCRSQPNLTRDWIATQLDRGWRLLPITLGPQASCSSRYPRYGTDETIKPQRGKSGTYRPARLQGRAEADKTVRVATSLGIVPGSTLWYDIEAFDTSGRDCRESALYFLSAWTKRLHQLDYKSGVYSSVASGIKILDDARVNRPDTFELPDRIWLARWDGVANTRSSYIRNSGWRPGGRVKQYMGGHNETWGGVTINIDRNFLDVGKGSWAAPENHCDGTRVDFPKYIPLSPGMDAPVRISALQCLLKEQDVYAGNVTGRYGRSTIQAVHAWQSGHGFATSDSWSRKHWMSLAVAGPRATLKFGSAGRDVRQIQRALNAVSDRTTLDVTGVFTKATDQAVRAYQDRVGLTTSGVTDKKTWQALRAGRR